MPGMPDFARSIGGGRVPSGRFDDFVLRWWRGQRKCSEAGFTLLEVVVAIAVLGIFLGAAFELLAVGLRSARTSAETTGAILLVRQKLDELSLKHEVGASEGKGTGDSRWSAQVVPDAGEFQSGAGGEDLPASLYQVRMRVAWPTGGREKSLELITLSVAVDQQKVTLTGARGSTSTTPQPAGRAQDSARPQVPKEQRGAQGIMR